MIKFIQQLQFIERKFNIEQVFNFNIWLEMNEF